jgi:hypothetical protein
MRESVQALIPITIAKKLYLNKSKNPSQKYFIVFKWFLNHQ